MPIYDRGYRRWQGELRGRFFRWFAIARAGIGLSYKGRWVWRFTLMAWLPLLYYALAFFVVGQMTDVDNMEKARSTWQFEMLRGMFGSELGERFIENPSSFRPLIWSLLIHLFMHYTQIIAVMIVVAIVGPKLVSEDLKSRALSLYFARPLTRLDYVAGKLAVVSFWIGMVTLAPALALYGLSILFSPTIGTLAQTILIVPKILLYSLVLMIGCGTIVLALSSLTPNSRLLGFAWAGMWVVSWVFSRILSFAMFPPFAPRGGSATSDWTALVSFSGNFDAVGYRIFGLEGLLAPFVGASRTMDVFVKNLSYGHDWHWSLLIIACMTLVSGIVLFSRIGKPGEV